MGDGRGMDHGLVIEELVALRGHVAAVEPQQLAPLRRVEYLQQLMRRAQRFQPARGAKAVGAVRVQPLQQQLVGLILRIVGAAQQAVGALPAGRERDQQGVEQGFGLGRVVVREIADIDIERDAIAFRPGVHGQVRFGEQGGAGDTALLALVAGKGMELLGHQRQARGRHGLAAKAGEQPGVAQQGWRAAAFVQISG